MRIGSLALLCGIFFCVGCNKATGALTIVNNGSAPLTGTFDKETITIEPAQWIAREKIPEGEPTLTLDRETKSITITKNLTTVIEPTAQSCFVVVDFGPQYGEHPSPDIVIVERYKNKKSFTTEKELAVPYGAKLPKAIPEGQPARRLHSIDCAIIHDEPQIVSALARLP